ncbi:hypothetical protein ABW20_dc0109060 [Dactylellina cionopaga]|nr:hypothetical protein ABW20_dc0109060 [Dactylellina cionopaga]
MSRITISWSSLLSLFALLILNVANTLAAGRKEPEICDSSSVIITTPDQLAELSNCTALVGDVYLNNINSVELNLDGVEVIRGMFQIHLADNTQRFSAENLTTVGGLFMVAGNIEDGSNMSEIYMPKLNHTAGLDLTRMPKLKNLEFPSRINNPTPAIRVTIMNTGLQSLDGLNIDYDQIQQVYFGGNPKLKDIKMTLKKITVNLDIDGSIAKPNVSFPELSYLNTANIHDVGQLDFRNLESMGGALGVYDSTDLIKLEMPKLKEIGAITLSVLAIANNTGLEDVIFPELEQITGGITAENNPEWRRLNGFPKLMLVTDDVDMKGAFTIVEFPMLYNLTGNFEIISTSGLTYHCKDLENLNTDTSKPFLCDPYGANIFRPADLPDGQKKKKEDDSGLTGPKITGIAIGCLACVVGPLILFRFIVGRRRKAKLREKDIYNHSHFNPIDYGSRSLPSSRAELPPHALSGPYELPPAKLRQELQGDIPMHEMDGMSDYNKRMVDVNTMPVPDSPIERVHTAGFDSDVSRLDSDVSSDDDEYSDSIVQAYSDPDVEARTPKNMIS